MVVQTHLLLGASVALLVGAASMALFTGTIAGGCAGLAVSLSLPKPCRE